MSSYLPASREGRLALAGAAALGIFLTVRSIDSVLKRRAKTAIRVRKQKLCEENIAAVADAVAKDKDAQVMKDTVTQLTSREIVKKIKEGDLTALQVLRAFQAKALEAHMKTNCVCWFFPEAEELARAADRSVHKDGLLFGLPISVKDHFSVKGHDSTLGVVAGLFRPYEKDCCLVEVLRNHGAIPFVRTNVPQLLLSYECGNPIFGYTTNPHDSNRGPGGSSGGEGAIIKMGGSPLGLGSDIGGSIRMPAMLCGVCGFKPCTPRMSKLGMPRFEYGQTLVDDAYGPMAPDMDSIMLAMQATWDGQMAAKDHKIPPLTFNFEEIESKKPLRIGYYMELDMVPAVPAVRRAVIEAKEALASMGHELVPYSPPDSSQGLIHEFQVLMAHGGTRWSDVVAHDKLDESVANIVENALCSTSVKQIKAFFAMIFEDPVHAKLAKTSLGMGSVLEYWTETEAVMDYRDKHQASWEEHKLDVVIGPTVPFPAMPKRRTHTMSTEDLYIAGGVYQMLYNVLDLPAGNVPVTEVTKQDIEDMKSYPSNSQVLQCIHKGMEGAEGLPLGVQVIAPRFRDERALRVMKELETVVAKTK